MEVLGQPLSVLTLWTRMIVSDDIDRAGSGPFPGAANDPHEVVDIDPRKVVSTPVPQLVLAVSQSLSCPACAMEGIERGSIDVYKRQAYAS